MRGVSGTCGMGSCHVPQRRRASARSEAPSLGIAWASASGSLQDVRPSPQPSHSQNKLSNSHAAATPMQHGDPLNVRGKPRSPSLPHFSPSPCVCLRLLCACLKESCHIDQPALKGITYSRVSPSSVWKICSSASLGDGTARG